VRIQLWSYNYDPEQQGIGPLSTVLAEELVARGHDVLVVAAHPHYPQAEWGTRVLPYRERRRGIPVLRLPLWIGRETGLQRVRQEVSFALALSASAPILPDCDVVVAVSPSFPALGPCMAASSLRGIPWVLWLQDLVTDAAASTGLLDQRRVLRAATSFERTAYASASRIVVISETFRSNLRSKGVPDEKMVRIYNPSTVSNNKHFDRHPGTPPRILAMGNIGRSQALDRIVEEFEASAELAELDARLVITGHGVEAAAVRRRIRGDRVSMLGVVEPDALARELRSAALGLVSQRADVTEFNLPSKLMNYMAHGVPVVASVRPESETARIVVSSGAGWVTDASSPAEYAATAARVLRDPEALVAAGTAGRAFAQAKFSARTFVEQFESVLVEAVDERIRSRRGRGRATGDRA
jgi:colanic acid biosynthesis glycosyl transferase WcaI